MTDIVLHGCTPEPLMGYLKALGVLRLVSEQADTEAKGRWENGEFVLRTKLNESELIDFFLHKYHPSPIIVPWSGGDFFAVNRNGNAGPFKKTPSSSKVIEAFIAGASSPRISNYASAIKNALDSLQACGIHEKKQMEDKRTKLKFIGHLRSTADEAVTRWIDVATILENDKSVFNSLLGSGGGSDGNTHFSDNFMQNLWEMLPEFAPQRTPKFAFDQETSVFLLRSAMFAEPSHHLVAKRTSALFDGGAVGGQNAGQGFERESIGNPWGIILCFEGTLLLAGALVSRNDVSRHKNVSFPFLTKLTPIRLESTTEREIAGREAWLPLWSRWVKAFEIIALFSEGRASIGRKYAEYGVDFARAVVGLGLDRGIDGFSRFAIVRGRIGGDNYNTSTSLGRFKVCTRADVDLLCEIDPWIDRFRRAASDDNVPTRYMEVLRRIESAIFEFCQYGGFDRFGEILRSLGRAEFELSRGEKFRDEKNICPLAGLSPDWLHAACDGSIEFELALAIAGIWDSKLGALRENLEPVIAGINRKGVHFSHWLEKERSVVWNSSNLVKNLTAILQRRLMDARRINCEYLPIASRFHASLDAIAVFIAGETDDEKISEWLWGMSLIDFSKKLPPIRHWVSSDAPALPRSFALLKLMFLPFALETKSGAVPIKPESSILSLLRADRTGEACAIAARRLRAGSFSLMPRMRGGNRDEEWGEAKTGVNPERLAASLLFPISRQDSGRLAGLITRSGIRTEVAVN